MMKLYSVIRLVIVGIIVLAMVGCGTTRELLDSKTAVNLTFITSKDLNPDQDGRPSPIIIKVFALTGDRQFKREDFLSLYEDPAERLGSDLIETYELREFSPDETRVENIPLTPDTRFIGVMAAFVQYDRADALMILPVTSRKTMNYTIRAERLRIRDMNDNI